MKDFLTSLYSQEYDVEEKNPDEEEKLKFVIEDDEWGARRTNKLD